MTLIYPGQKLTGRMARADVDSLGQLLRERILEMEAESAALFKAIRVWWSWYEAVPRDKEKSFPFKGASNVVVPLIGVTCDALASRSMAQITAAAPAYWSCRSENESRDKMARNMARYINWQADGNEFSLKHVLSDMLTELYVTGRSVAAINYRSDARPVFFGRTPLNGPAKLSRQQIVFRRGPMVEHVPSEHMLWDRRLRIGDAPMVVRKHEYLWVTLREMAAADDAWDAEAVREIQKHPGTDGDEATQVRQAKDEIDLRDGAAISVQPHDIREVWVDWSILGRTFEVPGEEQWAGEQVPLLVHLHMRTGKILRIVGMPYLLPYKPFVDFRFRQGRGVAKRLEQLQRIMTTLWNQAIDARTRANALWAKTRDAKHTRTPIDPSRPLLVSSMDEFEPLALHTGAAQDLPLILAAQQMAERWMGHSDPLLGRETRSGGHPAPATSTLALLEQVNVMSAGTDLLIQEELSRMGEALAVLNQQFEDVTTGRLVQILGEEDANEVAGYLFPEEPIPGSYYFDVVALSRTENPDAQMRRSLMVAQAYQNYGGLAAQGALMIGNPQVPPQVKAVWAKLLEGYGSLLERFLDAANVDDTEKYLIELERIGIDPRNAFAQFTRQAAAAAGGAAPAPGANGALGGLGGLAAPGGAFGAGAGMAQGEGAPLA